MIDDDVLHPPFALKEGEYLYADVDVIRSQQWLAGIGFAAVDGDVVKIKTKVAEMNVEVLYLKPRARGFLHAPRNFGQNALAKAWTVFDQQHAGHKNQQDQDKNSCNTP